MFYYLHIYEAKTEAGSVQNFSHFPWMQLGVFSNAFHIKFFPEPRRRSKMRQPGSCGDQGRACAPAKQVALTAMSGCRKKGTRPALGDFHCCVSFLDFICFLPVFSSPYNVQRPISGLQHIVALHKPASGRMPIRKTAHYIGAPPDFPVQTLKRIICTNISPML